MRANEFLLEAKEIFDYRHQNVEDEFKFFGSTKNSEWISPDQGFHWTYQNGNLYIYSTDNINYSWLVNSGIYKTASSRKEWSKSLPKLPWNTLAGIVDHSAKTITISKESIDDKFRQRLITDYKEFKGAISSLTKFGVTDEYRIKGTAPNIPKTVSKVLAMPSYVERIFGQGKITMYHGTSTNRLETIKREGLRPGNTGEVYVDVVPGYSEHNIYLTTTPKVAEYYAKRQMVKDEADAWVVLEIQVPDVSKIMADDWYATRRSADEVEVVGHKAEQIKIGLTQKGEVAYKGRIPPKFIKVLKHSTTTPSKELYRKFK